ncbi:2,3,4,5-tetrahydropyridine-2,6-dicarboxylate N-acetyltransferase, partial [Dysosmobacter welbionis]
MSKISCMESRAISVFLLLVVGGAQDAVERLDTLQGIRRDLLVRLHHRQGSAAPAVPVQAHVGDVHPADGELIENPGQLSGHVLVADHQGVEDAGEAHLHSIQPIHPDAAAAGGGRLQLQLPPVGTLHRQHRRVGVGIPQTGRVEVEFQPLVGGDLKALRNAQIVRLHPQEARHQRPVRAVASAGIGKGAVEADVRPRHFRPQQGPGHAADPHRPRCMGAGGAHHHRAQNIKDVQ